MNTEQGEEPEKGSRERELINDNQMNQKAEMQRNYADWDRNQYTPGNTVEWSEPQVATRVTREEGGRPLHTRGQSQRRP